MSKKHKKVIDGGEHIGLHWKIEKDPYTGQVYSYKVYNDHETTKTSQTMWRLPSRLKKFAKFVEGFKEYKDIDPNKPAF